MPMAPWLTIILIAVAVILVLWVIAKYNAFIRAENRIDNAWAQIDVQLQRRGELIPNLLETVKGYMKHEREVLENVTKARAGLMAAQNPAAKMAAEGMLEKALGRLFAVAEAYPDLKKNTNLLNLYYEITHTDHKIACSHQPYNDSVLTYSNAIGTCPGSVIASMANRKEKPMLADPEAARAVPKVVF